MQGGVVRVRCGLWREKRERIVGKSSWNMPHTHTRHAALPQRTGGFWPVSSRPRRMSHESVRRRRTSGGGLHGDRGTAPPLALRRRRAALTLARRQRRSGPRRPAPAPPTSRAEAARCAASWTGRWSAARPSRSAARGRRARRPTGSETRRQSRAEAPNRTHPSLCEAWMTRRAAAPRCCSARPTCARPAAPPANEPLTVDGTTAAYSALGPQQAPPLECCPREGAAARSRWSSSATSPPASQSCGRR